MLVSKPGPESLIDLRTVNGIQLIFLSDSEFEVVIEKAAFY